MSGNLELSIAPGRPPLEPGWTQASFDDALADLKRLKGILGWRRVRLVLEYPLAAGSPIKTYLALLMMAPRSAEIVSPDRRFVVRVNIPRMIDAALRSASAADLVKRSIRDTMATLDDAVDLAEFAEPEAPPFVWRTNLWFGANVGGSYSHAVGVLNGLQEAFGAVALGTTDDVHSLDSRIEVRKIDLTRIDGWHCEGGLHFAANRGLTEEAMRLCPAPPAFVYQRCMLGDVSGFGLARARGRPFVLEYNGSEIWVADKWGDGVPYADEFRRVETALLQKADLVLAVSRVLVDEAISRGARPERVLLSPNAVDPSRFHPDVSGAAARAKLKLGDRRLALLLSSFGPWHGVDVAISAFASLLDAQPHLCATTALVLAGDGSGRTKALEQARACGLVENETVSFPGMIPAQDAPGLLAAAEILLAPTVRNPDGSPFFGSPTKVFEYMAMGKTILASGLDQIGEILKHGETAVLVEPGDVAALSQALADVFATPERFEGLGAAARRDALAEHSWTARMTALRARLLELGLLPR